MENRNIVFVVGLLLAAGLLFFVITSSVDSAVYSVTVDEAVSRASELSDQEIKVKGNVVPGSIQCVKGRDQCKFRLTKGGETLTVFYSGARPDTFKDCAEVIVTGALDGAETFQAIDLIAKCPSKYDDLPGGCEVQPEDTKQARR